MTSKELRILFLEDAIADAELCQRELKRAGLRFASQRVDTRADFEAALDQFAPDLIISDFNLPGTFDGLTAMELARRKLPEVPFVFVSGTIGEERAVEAMKSGATDYVLKDHLNRLAPVIKRALQEAKERAARRKAEEEISRQRAFLRQVIDLDRNIIFARDREGRFTLVNQALADFYGCTVEYPLGRTYADINPNSEQAEQIRKVDLEVMNTLREVFIPEEQITDAAGRVHWHQVVKRPLISADGKANMVLGVATDITERKLQELKIARLNRVLSVLSGINSAIVRIRNRQELFEEACRIAVEHGGFGIAWIGMLDPETLDVIPAACAGVEADSLLARSLNSARPDLPRGQGVVGRAIREKRAVFSNDLLTEPVAGGERRKEAIRRGYRSVIALPLLVENTTVGSLSLFAKEAGFFTDEESKLLTELAGDISFALEHIAKSEKLEYLSYYDALTGLPNRQLFIDRVSQQMRARGGEQRMVALILLDLERFRNINETLGRHGGDELLKLVARRIEHAFHGKDYLAHIGAGNFGVVIRGVRDAAELAHAVEGQVLACFREPFAVNDRKLHIAARAGIALFPADGGDADTLFKNAEAALKNAKASGEHFLFYAPQMNARVSEQLKLENDLRNALLQEQYVLHYQPRFDLVSGGIVGLEALIRWNHPERGMVPPGDFIPLLEETGMIVEVGSWALKRAALDYAAWSEAGRQPPRIAVNVSLVQLRRRDFVDYMKDALATVKKTSDRIDIEITESMLMEDIEGSIAKLKAVQGMGLQVALDDFGTGYSSLSYLARLPIDSLKIDRSFITQMPKGPEQMAIVSTVVSLARALNLKVVAEGVETEEQANLLRLLRCDEVQGYLFGKPIPPDQIATLLAKQ